MPWCLCAFVVIPLLRSRSCPALVSAGAATWGYTRAEALRNIQDVARMVVDSLLEHGEALPSEPSDQVQILAEPQVAVIV